MELSIVVSYAITLILFVVVIRFKPFIEWLRGFKISPVGVTLLFLLFFGTFCLGGERSPGDNIVDTLRIFRIVLFVVITGVSWLDLIFSKKVGGSITAVLYIMFVYGIIAMSTAIYAENPPLTLWKGFEVITHVSVIAMLSRRIEGIKDALTLLGLSWLLLFFFVVVLLSGAVISPEKAFMTTSTGFNNLRGSMISINSNTATQIGGMLMLVCVSYFLVPLIRVNRYIVFFLFCASTLVMLLAHSRTSLFATALALCVLAVVFRKWWIIVIVIVISAIFLFSESLSELVVTYILRGQTEAQFIGLSGRVAFWEIVWDKFLDRPFFGYGFYSGIRSLYGVPGADNTYLQVLMGGGIVLMSIFIPPILIQFIQIIKSRPKIKISKLNSSYCLLWCQTASLFMLLIIRSTTGPSFDAHHVNLTLFLICSVSASVLRKANPSRRSHLTGKGMQ